MCGGGGGLGALHIHKEMRRDIFNRRSLKLKKTTLGKAMSNIRKGTLQVMQYAYDLI
jgi:hypothetical protein